MIASAAHAVQSYEQNMLKPRRFKDVDDLPLAEEPLGHVKLCFDGPVEEDDHPIHDLSACALADGALFVAGDESSCLERLTQTGSSSWGNHERFAVGDLLDVADPDEEIDIEGLAVDDGWLWVTGSHARTRPDPKDDGHADDVIDIRKLARLEDTQSRCVLARMPLVRDSRGHLQPVAKDGKRRAGMVKTTDKHGNKLAKRLSKDPLIGPTMNLAAKEGGLDIEGIAARGGRLALGLRGPVIRGYAVILEPCLEFKKSGKLKVKKHMYRRMVDLDGLGIRDLRADDSDLYILAGPTQDLDGRCAVFRWDSWVHEPPQNDDEVRLHRPKRLFDLPVKHGFDHPEGIEFWDVHGERRLFVLYDSPNPSRVDMDKHSILADIFGLPPG